MLSFESEVTFVAISLFLLPVANLNGYDFTHMHIGTHVVGEAKMGLGGSSLFSQIVDKHLRPPKRILGSNIHIFRVITI